MTLYEYQKSRSFVSLDPILSDSIFLNFSSLITNRPIEAKFHVDPPWDGGNNACSNYSGHMIKMATMSIYKIFFSGTERPLTLKLGMQLWKTTRDIQELVTINPYQKILPESALFGPRQANLVLIGYASSEGSGEPAHPRSLARTFAARSYKQWVERNLQTESQIPRPSEWLGMRS